MSVVYTTNKNPGQALTPWNRLVGTPTWSITTKGTEHFLQTVCKLFAFWNRIELKGIEWNRKITQQQTKHNHKYFLFFWEKQNSKIN